MAKIVTDAEVRGDLGFLAEGVGSNDFIPGGGRVDASAYTADANGRKAIPAGTLVGRNRNETLYGPVAFTASTSVDDEEVYISVHSVLDAADNPEIELLRHGTLIYFDKLPGWDSLDAAVQTWVHEHYHTVRSAS